MASASPVSKLLAPLTLLLLLLLLLSVIIILISLLQAAIFPPPLIPDFLSTSLCLLQGIYSAIDNLQQLLQSLGFLLSPCPIFILANLIVFTLLLKGCYSTSSSSTLGSEYAPLELTNPSHRGFFLVAGLDQLGSHVDYHVLSFHNYVPDEPSMDNWSYFQTKGKMSYNKEVSEQRHLNREPQKEAAQAEKQSGGTILGQDSWGKGSDEEASLVAMPSKTYIMGTLEPYVETQVLNEQSVPSTVVGNQVLNEQSVPSTEPVVVIDMEPDRQISCSNYNPSLQKKESLVAHAQRRPKVAEHNNSKDKKIKDIVGVAKIGITDQVFRSSKDQLAGAKQGAKGKRIKADKVRINVRLTRPTMARSQSVSGHKRAHANKPLQRATSMKVPSSNYLQSIVDTSTSLDGLSDAEANKRFSDFIVNRLAHMKKESLESN